MIGRVVAHAVLQAAMIVTDEITEAAEGISGKHIARKNELSINARFSLLF